MGARTLITGGVINWTSGLHGYGIQTMHMFTTGIRLQICFLNLVHGAMSPLEHARRINRQVQLITPPVIKVRFFMALYSPI